MPAVDTSTRSAHTKHSLGPDGPFRNFNITSSVDQRNARFGCDLRGVS